MKYINLIIVLFAFPLMSCKTSTEPEQKNGSATTDTLAFTYDSLSAFPTSQSLMLCGNAENVFIYGAYGKLSVYNIASKSISNFSTINDTITWRWDGAFVAVDSNMYILALPAPGHPEFSKVVLFNPKTYKVTATSAPFPFSLGLYPAYGAYGKKIVVLYPTYDSLYVFDTNTLTGQFVSQNSLKLQYNDMTYSSGIYQNGFYVYSNSLKKLYRVDLQTYVWQEIAIPDSILSKIDKYALGGMLGNKLCLFNSLGGSGVIVAFDLVNQKWMIGPKNTKLFIGSPVFYSNNASVYVANENYTSLWKISLTQ